MRRYIIVWAFLLAATAFEAFGDAAIRIGLFNRVGPARAAVLIGGALLLFAYGTLLNLAPMPFSRVVGLYVATLFVVWQLVNYLSFRSAPTLPIVLGGACIVIGGIIVSFWNRTSGP